MNRMENHLTAIGKYNRHINDNTIIINSMDLSLKEQISSYIKSLPNVELKHDHMSEEAYFYGLRNFAHFHGPLHIDIRLSKPSTRICLADTYGFSTPICSTRRMGFMHNRN